MNRNKIDLAAPGHTTIESQNKVKVTIAGVDACNFKEVPRHKNVTLGNNKTAIQAELHLEGDFKKTKKKLTWLADGPELTKVELMD
ncbi:hypothetical protein BGX26_008151 [Mortierella sp. AD094]|nr:hypothetical protein BGX26_008151 [Mortierella sp. AD094]